MLNRESGSGLESCILRREIVFMARSLRIEFPGALYRVTTCGNARAPIDTNEAEHQPFLVLVAAIVLYVNWLGPAVCLIEHHSHLVLATPDGYLSQRMR